MAAPTSHRRAFLRGSAGALALFAGCIADPDDGSDPGSGSSSSSDPNADGTDEADANESSDDGNSTDGTTENGDGTDSTADETGDDGADDLSYETSRYHYPESSTDPDATLLVDRDDATDWLADRDLEEDSLGAFVDDTPFADATLIALEAAAPNACYELVLEEIDVPDSMGDDGDGTTAESGGESLELEARVRDESDETEVCAQALTTVGVLVRAAVDAEPVTEISAVIVDDSGDEHEVDAVADLETED